MITGAEIRRRRLEAGLTQEALARLAGISHVTVARIEGEWRGRQPSPLSAAKLVAALDAAPTLAERHAVRSSQSAA